MVIHGTHDQDKRTTHTSYVLKLQHEECYINLSTGLGVKNFKYQNTLNTSTENKGKI